MGILDPITHLGAVLVLEQPARSTTIGAQAALLRSTGEVIQQSLQAYPESPRNVRQLAHIIAMERWGQRRLKCFLGEPAPNDESDAHYPPKKMSWEALKHEFSAVRQETLRLGGELQRHPPAEGQRVRHNSLGMLSPKAWLRYLDMHAYFESLRMRR